MKIVILDGHTLNPGDLDWSPLEQFGEVVIFDRTAHQDVAERIANADVVLTNKTPLRKDVLITNSSLKYIGVLATGFNVIDVQTAREKNIVVSNVPDYGTASVAQHTFALLLELMTHVGMHADSVKKGDWYKQPDFSYTLSPLIELQGKTLGIVGFGRIGQAVAKIALAFDMKVISYHTHPERDAVNGVTFVDLPTCFAQADVLSLHCPVTKSNEGFVNIALLKSMKPSAVLINVSRGQLINENDLAQALNDGVIAGAALDVLSQEPPLESNPLLHASHCVITPHIAWATHAARSRLLRTVVDNLKAFVNGAPRNVVN